MSHVRREFGMCVALVLLCLGLWLSNPDFLGMSNIVNTSRLIAMLAIFGIGLAFVIITGGIDLSVGSIIGLAGVLLAKICSTNPDCWGKSYWIGIPIVLAVSVLIGLTQGLLITRLNLQPFIVTLGFMLALRGVSQTIVKGGTLSFGDSMFLDFSDLGIVSFTCGEGWLTDPAGWAHDHAKLAKILSYMDAIPNPVLVLLVVAILATYFLHFTVFGRYVYAIGGNRDAAEYSGVNVKRVETLTYVISAFLAGVAGILYASYVKQMSQQVGIAYELYAIAGAVLGGCSLRGGEGTILGVVIGSAIMKVIENGINMFQFKYTDAAGVKQIWRIDTNWNFIIIGAVILIAVILDQVAHIVQAARRTKKAGETAPPPKSGFPG